MFATIYSDEQYARADVACRVDLVHRFCPDVVIDSFGLPTYLAARAMRIALVSILQGNFRPASDGCLWWKGDRPAGRRSAAAIINTVAKEQGVAPVSRCADLPSGNFVSFYTGNLWA